MNDKERGIIRDHVLRNAAMYRGMPNAGSVMGSVMSSHPGFRKNPAEVRDEIEKAIGWFRSLPAGEREREMGSLDPGMLEKKARAVEGLPPLRGAVEGKVVTRFAPAPTGPLTIFQLSRAVMLSYLYARKYRGRFIVRIEDTDARKVRKEYYGMIREDLKSAGVKWDSLVMQSDRIPSYYRHAEKMIRNGRIYACFCPAEGFRELKLKKRECPCRDSPPGENLSSWKKALKEGYREGGVVFRLRESMKDPNPVLRDPPLLRINRARHPRKGTRYSVWPLYNYSCTIDDHELGITHVFRGKEHEHNTAVQKRIYEALGWEPPVTINFGMVYLPGEKLHTRDVAGMISRGEVSGWDDPRLPTVRALLRRGFSPESFRMFAEQCGLTKHDINVDWETFYAINRKVIDPSAERYRVVVDPVEIDIGKCLEASGTGKSVNVQRHPDREGAREVPVTGRIFVSGQDFRNLRGKEIRLIDLFNVKLGKKPALAGTQEVSDRVQKIQWVPAKNVKVRIAGPEGESEGLGEPDMRGLKAGDVIQMIRIGFGRIDKNGRGIRVMFAHK